MTKKGKKAASADYGLIALVYNIKRLIKLGWKPKNNSILHIKHLYNTIKRKISYLVIDKRYSLKIDRLQHH